MTENSAKAQQGAKDFPYAHSVFRTLLIAFGQAEQALGDYTSLDFRGSFLDRIAT
jgi:hypothetical protein